MSKAPGCSMPTLPPAPLARGCPCPSPFVGHPSGPMWEEILQVRGTLCCCSLLITSPLSLRSSSPPPPSPSAAWAAASCCCWPFCGAVPASGPASEASGLYCLFCTTYIVLEVWIVLRLLAVVLIHSYREMHSELYRPAFEPQDYEMVELFVRRLKMWMGFSKAKEVRAAWGLCGEGAWWQRAASTIFSLSLSLAPSCSQVPLACEGWSSGHPWGPKSWVSDGEPYKHQLPILRPTVPRGFIWDPAPAHGLSRQERLGAALELFGVFPLPSSCPNPAPAPLFPPSSGTR